MHHERELSHGMKILVATGLYAPEIGGPATYTAFLERWLPSRGYVLTIIPFRKVRWLPRILRHLAYFFMLVRSSRDVDAIYALDTVSVGLPACIASMLMKNRFFLRVPGDYAWEQGQQRFGITELLDQYLQRKDLPLPVRALSRMQRFVARRAHRIIAPSEYLKEVVRQWGTDTSKIVVVPSAYEPVVIPETRDALRSTFGYETYTVITAGRLVPWKGMTGVVDAVVSLRKSGINVSLEIVGDGVEHDRLKAEIRAHEAETYVHLRGKKDRGELLRRIKAADAFVLNTAYEGLSHQLIEVMDIGTPIVTTAAGGNREVIAHEVEGLIVPYNDTYSIAEAIRRLMTEDGLPERFVERAHERVLQFKEEVVLERLISILR